MTAPPRPEWRNYPPILQEACGQAEGWPCWEVAKHWHAYAEHLERRIEQLEATQREARREPDCEQQAEPWGWP